MKTEVRKLGAEDIALFSALLRVFEKAFEMEHPNLPGDEYLKELLGKKDFLVFVVLVDGKVVGGLTAYLFQQYYTASTLAYIYDLAVLPEHQRKGIGKLLIEAIRLWCSEHQVTEIFVQADDVDDHAIEFYHASGADRGKAVNFYYNLETDQQVS